MLRRKREEIDILDEQIMELLDKRLMIVKEIGKYKSLNSINVLDSNREQEILNKIKEYQNFEQIEDIYAVIMAKSKELQNE